jgi:hypothetical protein
MSQQTVQSVRGLADGKVVQIQIFDDRAQALEAVGVRG